MTNKEYIEKNNISFSEVLKRWNNAGHLEEWLMNDKKPFFNVGDIIYSSIEQRLRKVVYVGKKYYLTLDFDDKNFEKMNENLYKQLIFNDDDMKKFIDDNDRYKFHCDSFYGYEKTFEKIGVAV